METSLKSVHQWELGIFKQLEDPWVFLILSTFAFSSVKFYYTRKTICLLQRDKSSEHCFASQFCSAVGISGIVLT